MNDTFLAVAAEHEISFKFYKRLAALSFSKQMLLDIAALIDLSLVVGSGLSLKYLYVDLYSGDPSTAGAPALNYLSIIALVTATLFLALRRSNHYAVESVETWTLQRGAIALAATVFFSFGFGLSVIFFLKVSTQFSRIWVLGWCLLAFSILLIDKHYWARQLKLVSDAGLFRSRIYLLGAGAALENAKTILETDAAHAEFVGVGDLGLASSEGDNGAAAVLDQIIAHSQTGRIDEVIIALPPEKMGLLDAIMRRLRLLPIDAKLVLELGNCPFKVLECHQIGPKNAVSLQKKPISEWNSFQKAIEDYVLGALALIVFLPAMAVIAILIKLDSRGPVLFLQRRHGFNHTIIKVMKFRTMTVLEDGADLKQACRGDARITRVGKLLRMTSLDELPQLFNVLKGEMSLVGPRPHAIAHNDYYSTLLDHYASRHRVKPGLTGWAQINGFRGEIRDPDEMRKRVDYDIEYIDSWSIRFDLKILLLTPLFGVIGRNAY
jgi:putative colanic acid biosysnthesis UDP-glucose lipid carrier transferase